MAVPMRHRFERPKCNSHAFDGEVGWLVAAVSVVLALSFIPLALSRKQLAMPIVHIWYTLRLPAGAS
jgi:hypothetical protein